MATPPEDSVEIISSSVNSQVAKHLTADSEQLYQLPNKSSCEVVGKEVYETVASLEENEFRIFLEEVTSQDRKKADKSAIAQAAQILLRKEEDALKEESGSGEDTQELLSACHKRKRLLKGKEHCDNSSAAARTSTGGSLGSLQDLTETNIPETSSAAGTKSGGSCGNLSRGSFKTQAPLKQRGKRLKVGRASTSIREGGSLQNLSKTEAASNEAKKLHKSGSLSQVFTDVGGARVKNRRQKTSSESSSCRSGRKSEEKDVGSDAECSEIPYRLLVTSPLPVPSQVQEKEMVSKPWNRDRMSDVASGESTEEDGESFHSVARSKLADSTMSSYGIETELTSVVTHVAHKDNGLHPCSADSEVDKKIKFCLDTASDNSLECGRPPISIIPSYVEVRDLLGSTNKRYNYTNLKRDSSVKYLLDGQPLKESNPISVTINPLKTTYDDAAISQRSNGYCNGGTKEYTYNRMKAKCDKRKILKRKNTIPIEETPGYVGNAPFSEILIFINDKNSNHKGKKKHKNKKEDDKDYGKKKKNGERISDNNCALSKTSDLMDSDRKRGKSASLRETSSVEDLVSKSKQNDADLFVKKPVAVEDGDVSPHVSNFECETVTSEFSHDFYQVGDAMINDDVIGSGEFEVVNRKKNRKNRIVSISGVEKVESVDSQVNSFDKHKRFSPPASFERKPDVVRTSMNFSEGVMFDGDVLLNNWSGNKSANCDRIGHTTSAPHSEGSESDGNDSVHSMPVKSMTPKPEMCHHPQSSDSTPQASYANIAKLSSRKKLERNKKSSRDDSALLELRKCQEVKMSDFPPLSEDSNTEAISQDTSITFSSADLTTSTKVRRNSVSNEILSNQNVNTETSTSNKNCLHFLPQNSTAQLFSYPIWQTDSFQRDHQCGTEKNSNFIKAQSRSKVNNGRTNNVRNTKGSLAAEPAVIFTEKATMSESARDIEFGFGVCLRDMLPSALLNDTKSHSVPLQYVPHAVTSQSKVDLYEKSVADRFRDLFVPPKDEVFPNLDDLCNLLTNDWEKTLSVMEKTPETVEVWKCPLDV